MIAIQENHHVELAKMSRVLTMRKEERKIKNKQKKQTSVMGLNAVPETLTSGKVLAAPARKSAKLVAPPPTVPDAPPALPPGPL
jgi:hypothetical protein